MSFNHQIKKLIARLVSGSPLTGFVHRSFYFNKKQEIIGSFIAKMYNSREALFDEIITHELNNEPINYLEFGVYMGKSIQYWVENYKNNDSKFYGFDTFTGIPEDWVATKPKGSYSANGKVPDIKDSRVEFIKGLFSDTLPRFMDTKFYRSNKVVIHLDADLYSSTMYVLNAFLLKLQKGDILIFDEWGGALLHEFKAFADFFSYCGLKYTLIGATTGFQGVAITII